jgi:exopolysaccharide biosynthesis polyprenyl glycosylphosphotransferase
MEQTARKFRRSLLSAVKVILFACLMGIFWYTWWFYYPAATFWIWGNYLVVGFYLIILVFFCSLYGATRIGVLRLGEIIYSFLVSLVIVNGLAYALFSLIARFLVNPIWLILMTVVQFFVASVGAFFINRLYFRMYPARDVAVVYSNRGLAREVIEKMAQVHDRYHVCVAVSETAGYDEIVKTIENYSSVMLCGVEEGIRLKIFSYCSLRAKRVYILPSFQDVFIRSSHMTQLFDTPVFYSKNAGITTEQAILKRAMDVVLSLVALVVTSPFMLITALCIKICDGGPVLYVQDRLTLNGKVFRLYKFRSMVVNAEKDGARLSSVNDDRITPVGKVIRKIRMDEMPQLLNILKGDMSIVGPRPERPEMAIQYQEILPEFELRLRVKAGLTGNAQIYGRYNTSVRDKLMLDLLYIENYRLVLDFKMIFMTVKILFMPESTEGIQEGTSLPADAQRRNDTE